MRIITTVTLTLLTVLLWPYLARWAFTRVPPGVPPEWAPRYRTWTNGQETAMRCSDCGKEGGIFASQCCSPLEDPERDDWVDHGGFEDH